MKLFEFEQLEEGIAQVKNVRGVCVLVNDHMVDQAQERHISPDVISELFKKTADLRNKFKPLEDNVKFYVWSKSLNAGLGLRKRLDKDGYPRVEVMTAINKLYDSGEVTFSVG